MSQIIIYKPKAGNVEIKVNLDQETVWLTQNQLAELFGKNIPTISEHITHIFQEGELEKDEVVRKFRITAQDGKIYNVQHYNLDMIISVGYRVNSKQGTHFRQWATSVLKDHLVKGYSIYKEQLAKKGLQALEETLQILQNTLKTQEISTDIGIAAIDLIRKFSKTWHLLLAYDEGEVPIPSSGTSSSKELGYNEAQTSISSLKSQLEKSQEASDLFGREREKGLEAILGNIEQTFGGTPLYKSVEEKAAHLLYFIIKNHPFVDGNKRIGSWLFIHYLSLQKVPLRLDENGLLALALLIAQSDPSQKEIIIHLVINMLSA